MSPRWEEDYLWSAFLQGLWSWRLAPQLDLPHQKHHPKLHCCPGHGPEGGEKARVTTPSVRHQARGNQRGGTLAFCADTCHESWACADTCGETQPGLLPLVPPGNKEQNNLIAAGNSSSLWKQGVMSRKVACALQTSSDCTSPPRETRGLRAAFPPWPWLHRTLPPGAASPPAASARSSLCLGDTTRPTAATAAMPPGNGSSEERAGCWV